MAQSSAGIPAETKLDLLPPSCLVPHLHWDAPHSPVPTHLRQDGNLAKSDSLLSLLPCFWAGTAVETMKQGFPGAGTEFLQGPHLLGRAGSTGLPPRRSRVSRGWGWGLKLGFVSSSPQLGDTQEEEAVEVPSH